MPKTDKEGREYIEQDGKRYYRDFFGNWNAETDIFGNEKVNTDIFDPFLLLFTIISHFF